MKAGPSKDWRKFHFEIQWKICALLSVITSWLGVPLQWIIAGFLPVPSNADLSDGLITILLVDVFLCWILPVNILHKLANWISHAHMLCYTAEPPVLDLFILNWIVLNYIDSWYGPTDDMTEFFPWNFLAANAITCGVLFFWYAMPRIVDPRSPPMKKMMSYTFAISGIVLGIATDLYGMLWEIIVMMSLSIAIYKLRQLFNELDATKTQLNRYKEALEKIKAQLQRNTQQYNTHIQKVNEESTRRLKELEGVKLLMEKSKVEAQKSTQELTELTTEYAHMCGKDLDNLSLLQLRSLSTKQLEANNAVKVLMEKKLEGE